MGNFKKIQINRNFQFLVHSKPFSARQICSVTASPFCISDTSSHLTGLKAVTHPLTLPRSSLHFPRDFYILITVQPSLQSALSDQHRVPILVLLPSCEAYQKRKAIAEIDQNPKEHKLLELLTAMQNVWLLL